MKHLYRLLPLVALALLAGCGKHAATVATEPELPAARVRVATARIVNTPVLTETTGTIRPVQRAALAAKVMGAIEELPVTLGQSVHAGDVVAKIAAGEISARVVQAQSQLNVARRDLDRERDLLTKGASTADMVKGLEDRLAMTKALVGEAEAMLAYTTLRAPFDGVVARKLANAGDLATPGMTLLEIEGTGSFEVEAALPDSLADKLAVGTELSVSVPVANLTFAGLLAELSSAADSSAHTVSAKITVPPGTAVRSGQFARIQIPGNPVPTLLVPLSAVSKFGQIERVFVAEGSGGTGTLPVSSPDTGKRPVPRSARAALRLVKTGAVRGSAGQQNIEILSGVDDGEQVVVDAPANLRDGQLLEIQP